VLVGRHFHSRIGRAVLNSFFPAKAVSAARFRFSWIGAVRRSSSINMIYQLKESKMPSPTKFAAAVTTTATKPPAPTLALVLDDIFTNMASNARHAAVLLNEHRRKFNRDAECDSVLSRTSSILHDMGVQIQQVGASMSEETRKKLDTPR
jgi:hypothetical protein